MISQADHDGVPLSVAIAIAIFGLSDNQHIMRMTVNWDF
uniref:MIP37179p1 n=1 Tax=Drosophila melanogaster TaxID=7227 RepID=T2GGJ6_DROME|nr:MIP37179p1 [Drosophila melanogaster]